MRNLIIKIVSVIKKLFSRSHRDNTQNTQKQNVVEKAVRTRRKKVNPAWWKRLYNLKKRNQIPYTSLQPLKTFGNFTPLKPFKKVSLRTQPTPRKKGAK